MKKKIWMFALVLGFLTSCSDTIHPIEVSIGESKINFKDYEQELFRLFGNKEGEIIEKEDEYHHYYHYDEVTIWFSNEKTSINGRRYETFDINYSVRGDMFDLSIFPLIDRLMELVLYVGGEYTPFKREDIEYVVTDVFNECSYGEQDLGLYFRSRGYDSLNYNEITYGTIMTPNSDRDIRIRGLTKASMNL